METTLLAVKMSSEILLVLITVASTAFAAYQRFKARDYAAGLGLTKETLDGMIVAIEALPESEAKKEVKTAIREVSDYLGTESAVLAERVKKVQKLLTDLGWVTSGDGATAIRATEAARQWRQVRDAK